ncbi:MAG: hydroxymethylglutaryl-CoA lyase [Thermomicrobiales bacterium]
MSDPGGVRAVSIVEVGPRDGLQNAPDHYSAESKVGFIEALVHAGVRTVEATSFVNALAVPRLSDADQVMCRLNRVEDVRYMALVPNERGYDRAVACDVNAIALFASATEAFSAANLHADIDETFERFLPVSRRATADKVWLRGYVSVAFGCPYSGEVDPGQVAAVAARLMALCCDEIALADTIGSADPCRVRTLLDVLDGVIPFERIAFHFHDTSGRAIANVDTALAYGIRTFDSAAGGLGGCPFAPGAPGNLATERLVEHCESRGIVTGIDAEAVRRSVSRLHSEALPLVGTAI